MPVLVLTARERLPDLTVLYQHLARHHELDIRRLDKCQQLDLRRTLSGVPLQAYSRVLVDLPFRHICRQPAFLRSFAGLLFYEEDASQNYMNSSRRYGAFSRFYRALPNARVIVTGAVLAERLRGEGVDAHFLGKGYDPVQLFAENVPRDIELGFVGRLASAEYGERQRLLQQLAACEPLQLLRTQPGAHYRQVLNRIQVFVSADMGFGEYMAKNFEAMACGCLLLAWRQPEEEQALGMRDGEQLLLYSSLDELREHIRQLRTDPARLQRIARAGQQWVMKQRSYLAMAEQIAEQLHRPWPTLKPKPVASGRWRCLWPF